MTAAITVQTSAASRVRKGGRDRRYRVRCPNAGANVFPGRARIGAAPRPPLFHGQRNDLGANEGAIHRHPRHRERQSKPLRSGTSGV